MDLNQMLHRFAYLQVNVERNAARGVSAPPEVQNEMSRLYSKASASLSPAEGQMALRALDTLRTQMHTQASMNDAAKDAKKSEWAIDKLSKDLTGLSADQVQGALDGETKVANKAKGIQPDKIKQYLAQETKAMGKPMTLKQVEKVMDRYNELRLERSPEDADKYITKTFGEQHAHRGKSLIEGLDGSGASMVIELQKRRGGPDTDHYIELDDDDHRRSQLAKSLVDTARKDRDTAASLMDDEISEEYLSSDHIHGDIARSMQQHEAAAEQHEIDNYQTPEYQVEDQDDVRPQHSI